MFVQEWWSCSTYSNHKLRENHLLPYANKRFGCSEATFSHLHVPPWLSCRIIGQCGRCASSAMATAWSHNPWCQVPSQSYAVNPYRLVGGLAVSYNETTVLPQNFVKRTAFQGVPALSSESFFFPVYKTLSFIEDVKQQSTKFSFETGATISWIYLPSDRTVTNPTSSPRGKLSLWQMPRHAGAPPSRMLPASCLRRP